MKTFLIISFSLLFSCAWAQSTKLDSLSKLAHKYDTTLKKPKDKVDVANSAINRKVDSLETIYRSPLSKVDSIQSDFKEHADSIQIAYRSRFSKLDSISTRLQQKADSLKSLKLPTEKYTHKLDSVSQLQQQATAKAEQKLESLKSQTTDKLKTLELPPELQSKVSDATKKISGFNLPGNGGLNASSLNLGDNPLGKLGNVNLKPPGDLAEIGKLTNVTKLPEVGGDLKNIEGSMKDVGKVTGEVGKYQKDMRNLTKGNINEVKELPKELENKAANLSGIDKLKGETKAFDQYKDQVGKLQDPDAAKAQVVEKAKQVAIDHFAGKEQVLQQAMDNMSKYKQKYSSLQSLADAKKRRPNEMRGKPIRERLLPGIGFQVFHKNDLLVDLNPYLGYRFNGRFTSGMGWNQRWAYTEKNDSFNPKGMIYGPRAYAEYNLSKGFFPRLELEVMNTFIPTTLNLPVTDIGHREWVGSAFVGLKKDYRFLKSVNGTTSLMFNLYNPKHKSPYADVVNLRFGFEFPIKKKSRKKS